MRTGVEMPSAIYEVDNAALWRCVALRAGDYSGSRFVPA